MSVILLMITALTIKSNAIAIVGTAALLHIPVLKWRKLSYLYIVFDSLLVSVAIATTSLGNTLNGYVQQIVPFEAEGTPIVLIVILWILICTISWQIEKNMLASYISKKQRKWQAEVYNKNHKNKSAAVDSDKRTIQGKNGYYISYEAKEPPLQKEPTVVLRDNYRIVLTHKELNELCYGYLTNEENAVKKVKEYGIEHEMINLAKYFVTKLGIRYFDQSMEKDLELIEKKAAKVK